MIKNGYKTSNLVPSQLPEFVRDDPAYEKFVLFVKSYYEWMEQNGQITDRTKNLLNYKDIDETSAEFLKYFYDEFLSYFPADIVADKTKVVKHARQLYQSKGTQDSFKFLFRVLFNSEVEFFNTKDAVLKASSGKWYVAKSLKLASNDVNFLNCINYRIFGETSKSIATIENAVLSGNKILLFISDIQRLFESGEFVRVVDSNNQDVLMEDGEIHRAKIVGQISRLQINPNNRGLLYRPGDPIVVYGGLNSNTGIGATATVGETTAGSIQRVKLETGGFGYRENPNTIITLTNAPGAVVEVSGLNPAANGVSNVAFIPTDIISLKAGVKIGANNFFFSNATTSNANTTLAKTFNFTGFTTYPISSVVVKNSGGGITQTPSIEASSQYRTDDSTKFGNLKNLGILGPIQIVNGGQGYQINDLILFAGGNGYGANAKVLSVGANGDITKVEYTFDSTILRYPLGGMGYRFDSLPLLSVASANVAASNASLYVPGILGDGATFSSIVDRVGSITSIVINNPGEDYVATPNVSLKVQDIVISNTNILILPKSGDIVYQGESSSNSTYRATVYSTSVLSPNGDPTQSLYKLRVYDYSSIPNPSNFLKIDGLSDTLIISQAYNTINSASRFGSTGVITYGDGTAKATATFLNGLVISQGQYLDTTGQPSSFDVLQNENYNNYTYQITVEKEIAKYRETLLNLLHPTGMKVIGRYAMKSNAEHKIEQTSQLYKGYPLFHYTLKTSSYATMNTSWSNYSSNTISVFNLNNDIPLNTFVDSNTFILLRMSNGFQVESPVLSVDQPNNKITIIDSIWLTYPNVAYITANSGSDVINITSVTNSYDIINNGEYSDPKYPIKDIVFAGDKILVANNGEKVVAGVDYLNGKITLTTPLTNSSISLMSVLRTANTNDVILYGPALDRLWPQLVTQESYNLITQDDSLITVG